MFHSHDARLPTRQFSELSPAPLVAVLAVLPKSEATKLEVAPKKMAQTKSAKKPERNPASHIYIGGMELFITLHVAQF